MTSQTMDCQTMQERLTARLSGALTPSELRELESHLAACATCAAEAAVVAELWDGLAMPGEGVPTQRMRARLDAALAAELERPARAPLAFQGRAGGLSGSDHSPEPNPTSRPSAIRRWLPLAAMLLLGLGLGYLTFGRRGDDVALLRQEVGDLHSMVALSLLEKGSASERLQGVAFSRDSLGSLGAGRGALPGPDDQGDQGQGGQRDQSEHVVAALFTRLLEDPNVNVRLAALEALRPTANRADHRGRLVAAVSRQESPLVALSLIDLLIESGTPAARHDLEQLLANDQLDPVVRGYLRDRLGRSA
ncbi:MAG: hypothetical protein QG573_417 [Acidobacteriota bacterium]|nr:hypothetical protein [Acidobacteriota bacterium]